MNRYFPHSPALAGPRYSCWPACVALLKQTGVIEHSGSLFVPLLPDRSWACLMLAERMSMTADGDFPTGYTGSPYAGVAVSRSLLSATPAPPAAVETYFHRSFIARLWGTATEDNHEQRTSLHASRRNAARIPSTGVPALRPEDAMAGLSRTAASCLARPA